MLLITFSHFSLIFFGGSFRKCVLLLPIGDVYANQRTTLLCFKEWFNIVGN